MGGYVVRSTRIAPQGTAPRVSARATSTEQSASPRVAVPEVLTDAVQQVGVPIPSPAVSNANEDEASGGLEAVSEAICPTTRLLALWCRHPPRSSRNGVLTPMLCPSSSGGNTEGIHARHARCTSRCEGDAGGARRHQASCDSDRRQAVARGRGLCCVTRWTVVATRSRHSLHRQRCRGRRPSSRGRSSNCVASV